MGHFTPPPPSIEMGQSYQYGAVTHGGGEACRVCRSAEYTSEDPLIAPCQCSPEEYGRGRVVHRSCLDRTRTQTQDRAFSACAKCHFEYRMHMRPTADDEGTRKFKYRFRVTRDFLLVLLACQVCICFFGWLIHGIDMSGCPGMSWGFKWGSYTHEVCPASAWTTADSLQGKPKLCGALRTALVASWSCSLAVHQKAIYYAFGMVTFFAIIGFIGCTIGLSQEAGWCSSSRSDDCYWLIWCDCSHTCHNIDGTTCCCNCETANCTSDGCGCCDCLSDGGGDCDEGGSVIVGVMVVVCIVLALVGLILSVVFLAVIIQKIMQRHMHILQKREYAKAYLVADLSGLDTRSMSRSYEPVHFTQLVNDAAMMAPPGEATHAGYSGIPEMPPPPYAPPMPNAPPMSKEDMQHLFDAGLI